MKHITIATYNICHGHYVRLDWSRIAAIIRASGADVAGFQEIDMHTSRIGGIDTVAELSGATGLPYARFVPAMDFDGGRYGTAILSRYPITAFEVYALNAGTYEPRSFGCATVTLDGGRELCFLNTHLSYESAHQQNIQFSQLAEWMERNIPTATPAILTGDFNTEDFSAFSPLKSLGYALANDEDHRFETFRIPPIAIDNIVYKSALFSLTDRGMIDSDCSDHNLLWSRFQFA